MWCDVSLLDEKSAQCRHSRCLVRHFSWLKHPSHLGRSSRQTASASKRLTLPTPHAHQINKRPTRWIPGDYPSILLTIALNSSHVWHQNISQIPSILLTIGINSSHVKQRKSLFLFGFSGHQSIQMYSTSSNNNNKKLL